MTGGTTPSTARGYGDHTGRQCSTTLNIHVSSTDNIIVCMESEFSDALMR